MTHFVMIDRAVLSALVEGFQSFARDLIGEGVYDHAHQDPSTARYEVAAKTAQAILNAPRDGPSDQWMESMLADLSDVNNWHTLRLQGIGPPAIVLGEQFVLDATTARGWMDDLQAAITLADSEPLRLDDDEVATVLAALRYWQREGLHSDGAEHDIASDCDRLIPLGREAIDDLCERINCGGS